MRKIADVDIIFSNSNRRGASDCACLYQSSVWWDDTVEAWAGEPGGRCAGGGDAGCVGLAGWRASAQCWPALCALTSPQAPPLLSAYRPLSVVLPPRPPVTVRSFVRNCLLCVWHIASLANLLIEEYNQIGDKTARRVERLRAGSVVARSTRAGVVTLVYQAGVVGRTSRGAPLVYTISHAPICLFSGLGLALFPLCPNIWAGNSCNGRSWVYFDPPLNAPHLEAIQRTEGAREGASPFPLQITYRSPTRYHGVIRGRQPPASKRARPLLSPVKHLLPVTASSLDIAPAFHYSFLSRCKIT
ncbi:hypothetical protein AAG570_010883 [Ranatra chinensis]|uniref:Uncharacterized protein n=1 Tax=Ranatra chinensis TaxID=642074 RepID=A0ABD0YJ14_9HEMI